MKIDDANKLDGIQAAAEIEKLLSECKVAKLPACTRAGIAMSTLHRWRHGRSSQARGKRPSNPSLAQFDTLRRAIMELAEEAGTLPSGLLADLALLRARVPLPQRQLSVEARVNRLERVVEEHLGVTL